MLTLATNSNEFDLLLHPIQIINMIFKSTNNFKMRFEYFLVFMNNIITANTLLNFQGTSNITTVGSIISGTWEGTAVDITHGGTGNTSN